MATTVWIASTRHEPIWLRERTARSFGEPEWKLLDSDEPPESGAFLMVRGGTWQRTENLPFLPKDPRFVGIAPAAKHSRWLPLIHRCGGLWARLPLWRHQFPEPPAAVYLGEQAADAIRSLLGTGQNWLEATAQLAFSKQWNGRLLGDLLVDWDPRFRVCQVVTSFQIGGAEKIAISLAEGLRSSGYASMAIATGRGNRPEWPIHAPKLDASESPDPLQAAIETIQCFGADLVHAHLLREDCLATLSQTGIPVVTTLHNTVNALPEGVADLLPGSSSLVLSCSWKVEREWRHRQSPRPPSRTLWNGITRPGGDPIEGRKLRDSLGIPPDAVVLLALANVRPQKRFDRLPSILSACQRQLSRPVHLLAVGEGTDQMAHPAGNDWHGLGLLPKPSAALHAADVLISCSRHEGLSLAQLEALSLGKPVVSTDVGGASEVAPIRRVSPEASPDQFAEAVEEVLKMPAPSLPGSFAERAMVDRAVWLYSRTLFQSRRTNRLNAKVDLWLVTNNLHIGGAQTSARRLLMELKRRGFEVRITVIEEHHRLKSHGSRQLIAQGIPVSFAPPIQHNDAAVVCHGILQEMDRHEVGAVLFWNLIASCKVILADAIWRPPIFDVSPGEMYFTALERYFASPRTGLPYLCPRDYGERLRGAVVKYTAEAERARDTLGCPVAVIPNGLTPLNSIPRESQSKNRLIIGTAARLSPDKKLEELIEAFQIALPYLPPCELQIVGGPDGSNGPYARSLRRLSRKLPIKWLGEKFDPQPTMQKWDICAIISEPAGCPNTSLEAMAAGLPVVATDHGGMREQVFDEETGLLVARAAPQELAEALIRLGTAPNLRRKLAMNGLSAVKMRFSIGQMADSYLQLVGLRN